ncbi:MAG: methyl-accepting chemotaxis protein, partial [Pseudomonadales bacterium]|nr:methyl-accepting chemotaxis protein [Pseudomonadales bacterium]
ELPPLTFQVEEELKKLFTKIDNQVANSIELNEESISSLVFAIVISTILSVMVSILASVKAGININQFVELLVDRVSSLAAGDLRTHPKNFKNAYRGELSLLNESFNTMTLSLAATISTIGRQAGILAHSSLQVRSISDEISDASKRELTSYNAVAKALESFVDAQQQSKDWTSKAKNILSQTTERTSKCIETVDNNIQEMKKTVGLVRQASTDVENLKDESVKIDSVTSAIHQVADQTGLIALNAAIEAARAGEHGRGFAVVADEVRNLSTRTSNLTDEISEVIKGFFIKVDNAITTMNSIIAQVDISMRRSEESGFLLNQMTDSVNEIVRSNTLISKSAEEQSESMVNLGEQLQVLSETMSLNASKALLVTDIGANLNHTMELVNDLLNGFTFDHDLTMSTDKEPLRLIPANIRLNLVINGKKIETISTSIGALSIKAIAHRNHLELLHTNQDIIVELYRPWDTFEEYVSQEPLSLMSNIKEIVQVERTDKYNLEIVITDKNNNLDTDWKALYDHFD